MFNLKTPTSPKWITAVLHDFDTFLLDHATFEKKASGTAMSMVAHFRDKPELITALVDLAIEELAHYREVIKYLIERGLEIPGDKKNFYIGELTRSIRRGQEEYLIDKLLIGSILERRGQERFGLVAQALDEGPLKKFYTTITQAEERHFLTYLDLAKLYFPEEPVNQRLEELLEIEAAIVNKAEPQPILF